MSEEATSYPKNSGPIPNVINDEWSKHLKGNEFKITFLIARKTFGFNKKWDKIAISQMAKYTGLSERTCQRVRKDLIHRGVILCKGTAGGKSSECCEYSVNMGWQAVTRDKLSPVTNDASRGDKMTPAGVTAATPTKFTLQNSQLQNTQSAPADDNPLSKPRLKSNASALCSEAMDAFNSQILKRARQPDYTMWTAWVALAGDEQAVFETVMGIIHASKIPDGPRVPFSLDGVFRDPARAAYWRAQYKPPVAKVTAEPIDFNAETMRELENMTDTERIARFEWYEQNYLTPPEEARKRWKHLMPNELKPSRQFSVA